MPMEEPVQEKEAGKDVVMGVATPTEELAPEQALALLMTLLAVAGIWARGPSDQVAGQGPGTSLRAPGKAPTIQVE